MIINKQGQVVANIAQPTVVFTTKAKYQAWVDSLPAPEVEANFIVIKTYELAPGGVYEVATNAERLALTADQKINETLYLVVEDNSGWRWNMPEAEGEEGSWSQVFGGGLSVKYVYTVEKETDLDALPVASKREDAVYIVKENDCIYRCEIGEDESGDATYDFIKIGGGMSIVTESIKVYDKNNMPDDTEPGDDVMVKPYHEPFTYDAPGAGKEKEFYSMVNGKKVYLKKYTNPAIGTGDYYYNGLGGITYIIDDSKDPDEEFMMTLDEFNTGIFYSPLSRFMELSALPDIVDLVVTDNGEVHRPVTEINGTAPMFKRLNGHSGKTEIVVASFNNLPAPTALTDAQKTFLYYTYKADSTDYPGNRYWRVAEHREGDPVVITYKYVPTSSSEFEEEVQTFGERSQFPSIPAEGVIYIAKKEGSIHIANPNADFTKPEDPQTNAYYLSVGTDIQQLIGRVEKLEANADDVKVYNFADFPGKTGGLHPTETPKEDVLYVAKDQKKCYIWMPQVGTSPGYYMPVGGDDLANMMPAMTWEDWEALAEGDRPDYVNIIPTVDEDTGDVTLPMFDGFAYTFVTTPPTP